MGQETSRPALYHPISKALPHYSAYGHDERREWAEKGVKPFDSEGDREQFIYGLISLMTSNGTLPLDSHTFKLLFSRRQHAIPSPTTPTPSSSSSWRNNLGLTSTPEPDDGTRLVATLVAIDDKGAIRVKIEPKKDGKDVPEAFRAFKKDVELRLERLLRDVPDGGGEGSSNQAAGNGRAKVQGERGREMVQPTVRKEFVDAPPAYGDVKKG